MLKGYNALGDEWRLEMENAELSIRNSNGYRLIDNYDNLTGTAVVVFSTLTSSEDGEEDS